MHHQIAQHVALYLAAAWQLTELLDRLRQFVVGDLIAKATNSSTEGTTSPLGTAHRQLRSPSRPSGMPIIAAWITRGWV
jgi:hypothetical protein